MKKYMLFDGNFDFDKFCDAVNSMKDEHIIFAHIVNEKSDEEEEEDEDEN